MVSVSGTVQHGPAVDTGGVVVTVADKKEKPKTVDGQPRVFAQTFVLTRDQDKTGTEEGKLGKYVIKADTIRFVG
jgi:NTF2-related export protein 1/2